jgi:hypothetical protein
MAQSKATKLERVFTPHHQQLAGDLPAPQV